MFANIESKNEIVRFDAAAKTITATWPLANCDSPSGLAIDTAGRRLFAVCDGGKMAVVDANSGKTLANPAIGDGPDAARYDATRKLAFSSNGGGTLTIIDAGKDSLPGAAEPGYAARSENHDPGLRSTGRILPGHGHIRRAARPDGGEPASTAGDCSRQLHHTGGRAEVSLLLAVLRLPDVMLRLSFIAFALSMTARGVRAAGELPRRRAAPITLEQAIALARANEPSFAAAAANARVAALDHSIARAALLPNVSYHNQVLYTQPNGVHQRRRPGREPVCSPLYRQQCGSRVCQPGRRHRDVGTATSDRGLARCRCAAVAAAELEIARRGLVDTVTGLFYQALAADHKVGVAQRAAGEAASFTNLTQQRESAREASACRRGEGAAAATAARSRPGRCSARSNRSLTWIWVCSCFPTLGLLTRSRPAPVVPLPARADVDAARCGSIRSCVRLWPRSVSAPWT